MGIEAAFAVIVWLASYPRSGNTLLRIILKHCFGVTTCSLYSDEEFPSPLVRELVGEQPVGTDPNRFLTRMRLEGRTAYVKTHELPGNDTHRAIYVVRDGRAALVSHYHYFRDTLGMRVSLEEVMAGTLSSSWSAHVQAWMFSRRPNLLTLRYEDLARPGPAVLDTIADFIGVPCARPFSVTFSGLHALMPSFFRAGSNHRNVDEMTASQQKLFETLHGATARKLGYLPEVVTGA